MVMKYIQIMNMQHSFHIFEVLELRKTLNWVENHRPVMGLCVGAAVGIRAPGAVFRKTSQVWMIVQTEQYFTSHWSK